MRQVIEKGEVVKLVLAFEDVAAMIDFAESLGDDIGVYRGDSMMREFNGHVPGNTFVVRRVGQIPEERRLRRVSQEDKYVVG